MDTDITQIMTRPAMRDTHTRATCIAAVIHVHLCPSAVKKIFLGL
jgi:hypothetical protein